MTGIVAQSPRRKNRFGRVDLTGSPKANMSTRMPAVRWLQSYGHSNCVDVSAGAYREDGVVTRSFSPEDRLCAGIIDRAGNNK